MTEAKEIAGKKAAPERSETSKTSKMTGSSVAQKTVELAEWKERQNDTERKRVKVNSLYQRHISRLNSSTRRKQYSNQRRCSVL